MACRLREYKYTIENVTSFTQPESLAGIQSMGAHVELLLGKIPIFMVAGRFSRSLLHLLDTVFLSHAHRFADTLCGDSVRHAPQLTYA